DQERRRTLDLASFEQFAGMTGRQRLVLWAFVATLAGMIFGVVHWGWYIEEIAALFLVMAVAVGLIARLSADDIVAAFMQGARDLVGTALVIALAKA
ncbi:YfcC family protein, partial [Escherichia coli]|nr:YfcC family protein [Escherichia coli]